MSSGQAALNYAMLNLADMGTNIVSVPQLYGTTHTLFAHILPGQGSANLTALMPSISWLMKKPALSFARALSSAFVQNPI